MPNAEAAFETFAEKSGIKIGARYRKFVISDEARKYRGRVLEGLPNAELGSRWPIGFMKPGFRQFEDVGIKRDQWPTLVPLAGIMGESDFFCVDAASARGAVLHWSNDEGTFEPFTASLDEFLAKLRKKSEKSLVERMRAARNLAAFEAIAKELEGVDAVLGNDEAASFFQRRGVALKKAKRIAAAKESWQRAIKLGSEVALLDAMALALEEDEPGEAIALGKDAVVSGGEIVYWLRRYLVEAYLRKGRKKDAERELRAVHDDNREQFQSARDWLEKLAGSKNEGAAIAQRFLTWFVPKEPGEEKPQEKKKSQSEEAREMLAVGAAKALSMYPGVRGLVNIEVRPEPGTQIFPCAYLAKGEPDPAPGTHLKIVGIKRKDRYDWLVVSAAK